MNDHWLAHVVTLLSAETSDLRSLALMCRRDPENFYAGVSLDGLEYEGQDLRDLGFDGFRSEAELEAAELNEGIDGVGEDDIIEGLNVDPEVSAIMVLHRGGGLCVDGIMALVESAEVRELSIVDNGASAENIRLIENINTTESKLSIQRGQGNVGHAIAANIAFGNSSSEYVMFVEEDVVVQEGCVKELLRAIETMPSPSVATAIISSHHYSNNISIKISESWSQDKVNYKKAELSRGCFLMRRADFEKIGGFDEGYFLGVEDLDLGWRIKELGGVIGVVPTASVIRVASNYQSTLTREFHQGVGKSRFAIKKASNISEYTFAVMTGPVVLLVALLRPLAAGAAKLVKGLSDNGRHPPPSIR